MVWSPVRQSLLHLVGSLVGLSALACATAPPSPAVSADQVQVVREHATPITGSPHDYDTILDMVGGHQFVLLGESTHGTHEFYRERARLTRRLIEEKGFTLLVLEADWPDAYDLNEFVNGRGASTPAGALRTFTRFPRWMWDNQDVRELVGWVREHNQRSSTTRPVGVYGMDLYSVTESMEAVVRFLGTVDESAAKRADDRYRCLRRYHRDAIGEYAEDVARGLPSCKAPVTAQFEELTERVTRAVSAHRPGDDALISAWQNSRVVANGEAYYRTSSSGGVLSWNLRDQHMADTIDAVSQHLNGGASHPAKVIVWAHNSHIGDARVTERAAIRELNVGQLMRQRHDGRAVLIGFTTYGGTVRAAAAWGSGGDVRQLKPAIPGSFSSLFHAVGLPAFSLVLRDRAVVVQTLRGPRPERFVGVIYSPATERTSHYVSADLARQYDAVIHVDQTTAVELNR
jgi:erythromycin esterase-like protein